MRKSFGSGAKGPEFASVGFCQIATSVVRVAPLALNLEEAADRLLRDLRSPLCQPGLRHPPLTISDPRAGWRDSPV